MRFTSLILMLVLAIGLTGCATNPNQSQEQTLQNARNIATTTISTLTVLINAGFIAKNDQPLKDLLFATGERVYAAFDQAKAYLAAGNKLDFQFYFDQAMKELEILTQYKSKGLRLYRAADPTTRPALPGGVSRGSSNRDYFAYCHWAGDLPTKAC